MYFIESLVDLIVTIQLVYLVPFSIAYFYTSSMLHAKASGTYAMIIAIIMSYQNSLDFRYVAAVLVLCIPLYFTTKVFRKVFVKDSAKQ